ncbi:hypothetical protein CLAFUW4_02436 [Fulvia fulva]|nr:hypothetical protein CLAFUR4_02431 [Fulvia fulva]KAK4633209.1 hypothetical protein CLAFUR0_02435 [Fulvia fulva]WPV10759.1 hypothetical protein CLAFUW4_02436 [Fulvia fulva]WPV25682.1 hypothetical protein CLAFUW7_02436 [Fulvia fulva]
MSTLPRNGVNGDIQTPIPTDGVLTLTETPGALLTEASTTGRAHSLTRLTDSLPSTRRFYRREKTRSISSASSTASSAISATSTNIASPSRSSDELNSAIPLSITIRNVDGPPTGTYLDGWPPVNIQPPLDIDIGFVEICVFFPAWLQIQELLIRLMRNAVTQKMLAKLVLSAVGNLDKKNLKKCYDKITRRISLCGKAHFNVDSWDISTARAAGRTEDMTANLWTNPSDMEWAHAKFSEVYSPVSEESWPTGMNRGGLLTQCIEWARDHQDEFPTLDTSNFG